MFPTSFIFTSLNAIFMLQLCFGVFGSGYNWEDCPRTNTEPCLRSTCKHQSLYSFWYAEPSFHSSADDLPCSPLRQAAVSLSSSFPGSSYKFAQDASSSLSTLAVCIDSSLQELYDLFMVPLTSSILFTSNFFTSEAQMSLPIFTGIRKISEYDKNSRFRMQDMRFQFQAGMVGPWDPVSKPSSYASCCTDKFCLEQLSAATGKQPEKFLGGSIPRITSSTSAMFL